MRLKKDRPLSTTPAPISPELANFDVMPLSAYIRLPVVAALYGISNATIWRNVLTRV